MSNDKNVWFGFPSMFCNQSITDLDFFRLVNIYSRSDIIVDQTWKKVGSRDSEEHLL
jgi:hypothetical protein